MQAVLRDVVVEWDHKVINIPKDIVQILPDSRVILYGLLCEQVSAFILQTFIWLFLISVLPL